MARNGAAWCGVAGQGKAVEVRRSEARRGGARLLTNAMGEHNMRNTVISCSPSIRIERGDELVCLLLRT